MDVSTANGFAKFLHTIMDYDHDNTEEEIEMWRDMEVSVPIVTNMIVTLPDGKQYNVSVKPVSK